jgi:hypothetical protein
VSGKEVSSSSRKQESDEERRTRRRRHRGSCSTARGNGRRGSVEFSEREGAQKAHLNRLLHSLVVSAGETVRVDETTERVTEEVGPVGLSTDRGNVEKSVYKFREKRGKGE